MNEGRDEKTVARHHLRMEAMLAVSFLKEKLGDPYKDVYMNADKDWLLELNRVIERTQNNLYAIANEFEELDKSVVVVDE